MKEPKLFRLAVSLDLGEVHNEGGLDSKDGVAAKVSASSREERKKGRTHDLRYGSAMR